MSYRSLVLVVFVGLLAGCAAPASDFSPSASPALTSQPESELKWRTECERAGGVWFRETGYCEYQVE